MLSNRTQTNGPVYYTKGAAPYNVMAHILILDFFSTIDKKPVHFY